MAGPPVSWAVSVDAGLSAHLRLADGDQVVDGVDRGREGEGDAESDTEHGGQGEMLSGQLLARGVESRERRKRACDSGCSASRSSLDAVTITRRARGPRQERVERSSARRFRATRRVGRRASCTVLSLCQRANRGDDVRAHSDPSSLALRHCQRRSTPAQLSVAFQRDRGEDESIEGDSGRSEPRAIELAAAHYMPASDRRDAVSADHSTIRAAR